MNFEQIAARESAWLVGQEARIANIMVKDYRLAISELETYISGIAPGRYKRTRLLAIKAQLEQIVDDWQTRSALDVGAELGEVAQRSSDRALRTRAELIADVENMALDSHVLGMTQFHPTLPQAAIKHLALKTHMDLGVLGMDLKRNVFNELTQSLIHGEGVPDMARRLKKFIDYDDVNANSTRQYNARLNLIARMRTADARTSGTQEGHRALNKRAPGSVQYEMVFDQLEMNPGTRNHYFSWAIHGLIRRIWPEEEPFTISRVEVDNALADYIAITGRKTKGAGVLWGSDNSYFYGYGIPAHYNDRATIIAWDPLYAGSLGIEPKHPDLDSILGRVA